MAETVVGYAITAKLDAFRAELGKIPEIGAAEAKNLTAAFSKEIRALEKATREAAKASKDAAAANKVVGTSAQGAADGAKATAAAMGNLRSQIIDVGVSLQGGMNPLTILSQQGPQIAEALMSAEGAAAAFASTLGSALTVVTGVGLVLAPLIGLWSDYADAVEDAKLAEDRRQTTISDQIPLLEKVRGAQELAMVELGQLTDAEHLEAQAKRDWASATEKTNQKLEDQNTALQLSLKQIDEHTASVRLAHLTEKEREDLLDGLPTTIGARSDALAENTRAIAENTASAELGLSADIRRIRAHEANTEATKVESDAEKAAAEAKRKAAEATRDAAEAARKAAEAAREEAAAMDAVVAVSQRNINQRAAEVSATASLTSQVEQLGETEYDRIGRTYRETDALLQQQIRANQELGLSTAGLEASRQMLRQKTHDLYAKLSDEEVKKEQSKQQTIEDTAIASAASIASAVQQVASAVQTSAEEGTDAQKQQAMIAFEVSQAAAVASTIITTASAAMKAYSAALELGAPGLILAPIAAASTAAVGAAQVAAIVAQPPPKFHAGVAPDEIPAVLKRGEGVLSGQGVRAAGGSDAVRALNAGHGSGAVQTVVIKHGARYFDSAIAENLKSGGSLAKLRAGRVGHSRRKR